MNWFIFIETILYFLCIYSLVMTIVQIFDIQERGKALKKNIIIICFCLTVIAISFATIKGMGWFVY